MPVIVPPFVFGVSGDLLGDHNTPGGEDLVVQFELPPYLQASILVGDAPELTGHAQGGVDNLQALGGLNAATAIGDAETIADHARGGDDLVLALARGSAVAYGDALAISGHGVGGNDSISAGSRFNSIAYGDAGLMTGHAHGGDDTLTASTDPFVTPVLFGDADTMQGHAQGGDDVLKALDPPNTAGLVMYGDARVMADNAVGGDDTLISGRGADTMYGDAAVRGPHAATGADLFVFSPLNGHDQIMDFEPGKDRIELQGFGITGFQDLASHFQASAGGVLVSFDANDDILVRGVTAAQLNANDFVFA
jgi:hypothetical protein